MSDDLTNRGSPDRDLISLKEPHELLYWKERFKVSEFELRAAVGKVGHSVKAVEALLKDRK